MIAAAARPPLAAPARSDANPVEELLRRTAESMRANLRTLDPADRPSISMQWLGARAAFAGALRQAVRVAERAPDGGCGLECTRCADLGHYQYMIDLPETRTLSDSTSCICSTMAQTRHPQRRRAPVAGENRPEAAVEHYRLALSLDTHPPTDYRVRTNLGLLLVNGRELTAESGGGHPPAGRSDRHCQEALPGQYQAHRDLPTCS